MAVLYELPWQANTSVMSLRELRDAMIRLQPRAPSEGSHGDADSILEELVDRWARMNESEEHRALLRDILTAYRSMEKWYA